MSHNPEHIASRFCVAGINFHDAIAEERSLFAIPATHRGRLLREASKRGFRSLLVLSTCNRTELYGFCESDKDLTDLLLDHSRGTQELFDRRGFVLRGREALEHLFRVAAGLESQITGDFEIAGQLRDALMAARQAGLVGPLMDRTVSYALQASKAVRSSTALSSGTVSVSYAAVKWLNEHPEGERKSFLVLGSGALARNVVRNIHQYARPERVTIVNRTEAKAMALANETNSIFLPFADLPRAVQDSDVLVVCTSAPTYLLTINHFCAASRRVIIDLSVPQNVDPAVGKLHGITLVGVDEVSRILNLTHNRRRAEIPKAEKIIHQHLLSFYEWLAVYRHTPLIRDMEEKLYHLGGIHYPESENAACGSVRNLINKTIGRFATNLREKQEKGCQYIRAINEFLGTAG